MNYCIPLQNKHTNPKYVGNKAYWISKASGFSHIPNGFVITSHVYDKLMKVNHIQELINRHLSLLSKSEESVNKASEALRDAVLCSKFPADLKREIRKYANKLKPPYVVRSSSNVEDSEELSFAGLFESFLNVDKKNLETNIKKVFASLFSKNALLYMLDKRVNLRKLKMAVIVQEMVMGEKFGTGFMFKHNKVETSIIESTISNPESVTMGGEIPDLYVIKRDKIEKRAVNIGVFQLFDFEVLDIVKLMKKCSLLIFPLDIEWAIKGGVIYLLQARHLTADIKIPVGFEEVGLYGIPTYPKSACGKAVVWKPYGKDDISKIPKGKKRILVASILPIWGINYIKGYGGIIIEFSGITSHAAILSREYKIPCVVGVRNATEFIHNDDFIELNGKTGQINLPKRKGISLKKAYTPTTFDIKRIEFISYNGYGAILYKDRARIVISYPFTTTSIDRDLNIVKLKLLIKKVQTHYNKSIIDGGSRLWDGCGLVLEFGDKYKDIGLSFKKGIRLMDNAKNAIESSNEILLQETKNEIKAIADKGLRLISRSNTMCNEYEKYKNMKLLYKAAELLYTGFAYWKIFNSCMMNIMADDIMVGLDAKTRTIFVKFIKNMWRYIPDADVKPNDINTVMVRICKNLAANFDIRATGIVDYLTAIKDIVNNE